MSQSSFLASFDPLAVHPFTNTSGLLPKPIQPSPYPMPLPSPATLAAPSTSTTGSLHAPQPKHASPTKKSSGSPAKAPVFVPFRPERSSPDLEDILLKKKVSNAMSNKQTWSIDQAPVPAAFAAKSKATRTSAH